MKDSTFGPAFDSTLDKGRVMEQLATIRTLMLDGQPRTLGQIEQVTGYPQASISAQLRHLRKKRFGSYLVTKRRVGGVKTGLWEYSVQALAPVANAQA